VARVRSASQPNPCQVEYDGNVNPFGYSVVLPSISRSQAGHRPSSLRPSLGCVLGFRTPAAGCPRVRELPPNNPILRGSWRTRGTARTPEWSWFRRSVSAQRWDWLSLSGSVLAVCGHRTVDDQHTVRRQRARHVRTHLTPHTVDRLGYAVAACYVDGQIRNRLVMQRLYRSPSVLPYAQREVPLSTTGIGRIACSRHGHW
jgi:hypothetical protein